jgi:hypothetical protein
MPNDLESRVGHQFTFRTDPVPVHGFDGIVRCEVLELVPARRPARGDWRRAAKIRWQ